MRILYIGNWVRSGKFYADEFKAAKGFEQDGHEVVTTAYAREPQGLSAKVDVGIMESGDYDFVLWSKLLGGILPADIKMAKAVWACPHVMWHWDGCYGRQDFDWFWRCVPEFDLICHGEACFFDEREKEYGTPWRYLHNACDPEYHKAVGTPRPQWQCDVGFIGEAYSGAPRIAVMTELAQHFSARAWATSAHPWQNLGVTCNGPVFGDDIADACASTKIMIGSSSKTWCKGSWSNRVYTVLGSGGFFLTEAVEGLDEAFTPGRHLVLYQDIPSCVEAVQYWLERPDERERIAARGAAHVRMEHTWRDRARQMIQYLKELNLI